MQNKLVEKEVFIEELEALKQMITLKEQDTCRKYEKH